VNSKNDKGLSLPEVMPMKKPTFPSELIPDDFEGEVGFFYVHCFCLAELITATISGHS